jgi:uncharacterized protein
MAGKRSLETRHAFTSLIGTGISGPWRFHCATLGGAMMSETKYATYGALDPFFELVQKGLGGLVDGEHYFDTIAEDALFEFLYEFPGWPCTLRGRAALMAQYAGYGDNIKLHTADNLVVHNTQNSHVIVLEYQVHGTVLATNVPYNNRFVSVITIDDRKIVRWRDYMDSLAAWNALTVPARNESKS